jgi:hypothetical protein
VIRKLLELLPRTGPLVVLFDDTQWASRPSRSCSSTPPAGPGVAPLQVVCLARGELLDERADWARRARTRRRRPSGSAPSPRAIRCPLVVVQPAVAASGIGRVLSQECCM